MCVDIKKILWISQKLIDFAQIVLSYLPLVFYFFYFLESINILFVNSSAPTTQYFLFELQYSYFYIYLLIMGNCVGIKRINQSNQVTLNNKLKKSQEKLLLMMYADLAYRSSTNKLTRQNFDIFFHLNGLWGQQIFNRFDIKKVGYIEFSQFKFGIELLVKGTLKEKVHALFNFYDIHKTNGVSYEQLLKMVQIQKQQFQLYSYPKQQLKKMIDDEKFLNDMNIHERYYHFGKHKILDDNRQVVEQLEQQYESEKNMSQKQNRSSDATKDQQPRPNQKKMPKIKIEETLSLQKKNPKIRLTSIIINKQKQISSPSTEKKKAASTPYFNSITKKKFKVSSNLSLIVKKYATYLFKQFQLDKESDQLSQNQFNILIQKHQKLFTSYLEGFHTYVWQVDNSNVPINKNQKSWIQSYCQQINLKTKQVSKKYLKFIRMTLFIYQSKEDDFPCDIKNLQGLQVQQYNRNSSKMQYGFLIKHRDGIYPEKVYCFQNETIQKNWLANLKDFKNNSIYDLYKLIQKIGTGNFSIVYKGIEKLTNREVAIKVIQKQKLSQSQNNVIKHQCQILALCHHPCIVKFNAKLHTKTHLYIITQYINEGVLEQYIRKKCYLSEYQASIIMKQLIQTLIYINSLGLIHRDLKPENIMIRLNKQKTRIQKVKIIDFGFAIYKDSLKNLKQNQKFAGTPGFLAPEVIKLQEYDQTVDNFSLGVILYFMLSGILPFDSPCDDQIIKFTLRCNIRLQNAHWANISQNGKDLVKKLLTHKQNRISLQQAIKHPWITDLEDLLILQKNNNMQKPVKSQI